MLMGEKTDEAKLLSKDFWGLLEFKLSIVVTLQKHCRDITTEMLRLFKQNKEKSIKNT